MSSASPLPWQLEPIGRIAANLRSGRSCCDLSDPGVGKTFSTLFAAREAGAALGVVCPKSVVPAWREAAGMVGVRLTFCTNIEQLKTDRHFWLDRTRGGNWRWKVPDDTVLVFDECHGFAGAETENGLILACAPRPSIMLSATAADSPLRMRAIAHQLGLCAWPDFYTWAAKQGCEKNWKRGWVFRGGAEAMAPLHRQLFESGLATRVRIADLGDAFPENRIRTIEVPVEDPETISDEYAAALRELRDGATTDMGRMTRCRQLAEYAKIPALIELARNDIAEGRSVVLFVNYKDTVARLAEALKCPRITGDESGEEREAARKAFQENEVLAAACTLDAAAQSISMHDIRGVRPVSTKICPGFSARALIQAFGRAHRAKGKSPVDQTVVFAAGVGVEKAVRWNVERKKGCIETLNDGDLDDGAGFV